MSWSCYMSTSSLCHLWGARAVGVSMLWEDNVWLCKQSLIREAWKIVLGLVVELVKPVQLTLLWTKLVHVHVSTWKQVLRSRHHHMIWIPVIFMMHARAFHHALVLLLGHQILGALLSHVADPSQNYKQTKAEIFFWTFNQAACLKSEWSLTRETLKRNLVACNINLITYNQLQIATNL